MSKKKKHKSIGQAALEYIITYSWAISLIAIAAAILVTTGFPGLRVTNIEYANVNGFTVLDFKADANGDLTIQLANLLNRQIKLTGSANVEGTRVSLVPVQGSSLTLAAGQSGTYVIRNATQKTRIGEQFQIQLLSLSYVTTDNGLAHVAHGSVQGSIEEATPIPISLLFEWSSEADFNQGNYNATNWNKNGLTLSNAAGEYLSDIRDAGQNVTWNNVSILQNTPITNPSPIDNSTVGAWNFEEFANPTQCQVSDKGKDKHKGVKGPSCDNGPINGEGVYGEAAFFDGVDDFINVSDAADFNIDNITIEVWVYRTSSRHERIVEKGDENQYKLRIESDDKLSWIVYGVGELEGNRVIPLKNWTYVVATFQNDPKNKSHVLRTYVNGQLDAEETDKGKPKAKNNLALIIGKNPKSQSYFRGYIDELRIYNRTLNQSEITQRYVRSAAIIRFQARSCDDPLCDKEKFTGPDGTQNTVYRANSYTSTLSLNLSVNRYVQFKTFMSSENLAYGPKVHEVAISASG